jgi:hypothetical protein
MKYCSLKKGFYKWKNLKRIVIKKECKDVEFIDVAQDRIHRM